MPQTDHETISYIRALELEVTQAEADWEDAKAFTATKKKIFDGRVEALREAIRKTEDTQESLDFIQDATVIDESHRLAPATAGEDPEVDGVLPENPVGEAAA
jgi:hypothetical protein